MGGNLAIAKNRLAKGKFTFIFRRICRGRKFPGKEAATAASQASGSIMTRTAFCAAAATAPVTATRPGVRQLQQARPCARPSTGGRG